MLTVYEIRMHLFQCKFKYKTNCPFNTMFDANFCHLIDALQLTDLRRNFILINQMIQAYLKSNSTSISNSKRVRRASQGQIDERSGFHSAIEQNERLRFRGRAADDRYGGARDQYGDQ